MAGELTVVKVVELPLGIVVDMSDRSIVTLTVDGSMCSHCLMRMCEHIRLALPYYEARKWDIAEANVERWGPGKFKSIGIDPRIFNRPGEIDYFPLLPEQWAWGELEMMVFEIDGGYLATFADGGHLWMSERHPHGGTKCLKCHSRECTHSVRAREEIEAWVAQR